ncbi:thiamine-phosphate kinase [Agaribacterium haliotis]|uniref:thiamine-phosphate kinase n=1 Tax=Agaribacterium haliotis TaxID=2013869 RepID=UPI001EFCADFD|nr:thiamine-phosphate kinase [Agaribacterium haliotis]
MDEFGLIKAFFSAHGSGASVRQGVGDDCAVLTPPSGHELLCSVDTVVAGRHFPAEARPELVASRAVRTALSDLAAMGAEPLWMTLALTLPHADEAWLKLFSRGLYEVAEHYGVSLVGGDTTKGPLCISVHVTGSAPQGSALLRSGAKVGDEIFVSGSLGDAAAGLQLLLGDLDTDAQSAQQLKRAYWKPEPRIKLGQELRARASACIDISDGLLADLGHLAEASAVKAVVDSTRIPLSQALLASAPTRQALEYALSGGDDYQLCFTAGGAEAEQLKQAGRSRSLDVTRIGEIVEGQGVVEASSGAPFFVKQQGFQHF